MWFIFSNEERFLRRWYMNRRQREAELLVQPRRKLWGVLICSLMVLGLVGVFYTRQSRTTSTGMVLPSSAVYSPDLQEGVYKVWNDQGRTASYTMAEAGTFCNQLFDAVNPQNPENSYMTPFMKEKLLWVREEAGAGRLRLDAVPVMAVDKSGKPTGVLATTSSEAPITGGPFLPTIRVYMARCIFVARIEYGLGPGEFDDRLKNLFALALVHEAVHLERPEFVTQPYDMVASIEEEARTWNRVVLYAVRPLRARNIPLPSDLLKADDILRSTNDNPQSPIFRGFIDGSGGGQKLYSDH
jgi:hypothetical protein